ncbi:MAG: OmpA family protein [Sandaracinaceae bacterium]
MVSLAGQLSATLPVAQAANQGMHFSGEDGVTVTPEVLAEVRPIDLLRITANIGARIRATDRARFTAQQLDVSHELTWGIGAAVPVLEEEDRELLTIHGQVFGATTFDRFGDRAESPIEILLGARSQPIEQLSVGAAFGTGLARGYGAPDFRGVLTVGWVQPLEELTQERVLRPGPGDRDGDGVSDTDDGCPDEPEDDDDFQSEDGCPDPDNDGDGVLDADDGAPNAPEDTDGFEDEDGVPDPDNDRDGVADADDACRDEAEDIDGIADSDGCPETDADGDDVSDEADHCPMTPGVLNEGNPECSGCPERACVSDAGEIRILDRVEFETGSDHILERSTDVLEDVVSIVRSNNRIRSLRIEGHTDDRGDAPDNLELSVRRSAAVRAWLVEHGVEQGRLRAFGCGELHERTSNATANGRQENRRVEFYILEPAPPGGVTVHEGCQEAD